MKQARWLSIALLLALLAGANYSIGLWHDNLFERLDTGPRTAVNILLSALGDIRTFLARSLYFETDIYHHEEESEGIYWANERDILPLYRMIAMLDPHFVNAYDEASYQLIRNLKKVDEGFAFLDEGLAYNPDSYQLVWDKAFFLWQLKRYKEAIPWADKATRMAGTPEHLEENPIDFLNCIRALAHCYGGAGLRQEEIQSLRLWHSLRPLDPYPRVRLPELGEPLNAPAPAR
jgi:hypothetical protein